MSKMENSILYIAISIIIVWLLFGFTNYFSFRKNVLEYKRLYLFYLTMETNAGEIPAKVDFFNKREELIQLFPSYHIAYEEMEKAENEVKYLRRHLRYFLFLGPIYNL